MIWFQKKTSLVTNFRIEVHLSIGINIDSYSNLVSFMIGNDKLILFVEINDIDALVS